MAVLSITSRLLKVSTLSLGLMVLSACSSHHQHPPHKVKKHPHKPTTYTVVQLNNQHTHANIIVVNKKINKRNCWQHGNHFHCKK